MPLVFHEMGHNMAGKEAGASIEVFLREGLISKASLKKAGKLPPLKNPYEIAMENVIALKERKLQRRNEWELERREALKDQPDLLKQVLEYQKRKEEEEEEEEIDLPKSALFYVPGNSAHREEHVFFGYSESPSSDRDWVAIEVPETAKLHDTSCRDRNNREQWLGTAVTIQAFMEMQSMKKTPNKWQSKYNEHLIRDSVPPERIVAYAKVEKELPFLRPISAEQLEQVQNFVSQKLRFATQYDNDPQKNILVHENGATYQIRVSLNKAKVTGEEEQLSEFFKQFSSMDELVAASQESPKKIAIDDSTQDTQESTTFNCPEMASLTFFGKPGSNQENQPLPVADEHEQAVNPIELTY